MSKMITKTIGGLTLNIVQLNVFKKIHLDAKVLKMLAPIVKGLGSTIDFSKLTELLDMDLDIGGMIDGLTEALGALNDAERESMILELLSCVTVMKLGAGAFTLDSADNIDTIFGEDLILIYKVLWAVMEVNKLSPFVLISRGKDQMDALTSDESSESENGSGS